MMINLRLLLARRGLVILNLKYLMIYNGNIPMIPQLIPVDILLFELKQALKRFPINIAKRKQSMSLLLLSFSSEYPKILKAILLK